MKLDEERNADEGNDGRMDRIGVQVVGPFAEILVNKRHHDGQDRKIYGIEAMGEDEKLMWIGPQSEEFADFVQTPDHEETDEED